MKKKPKCKIDQDGTKRWYLNGKRHRTDGPAVVHPDGTKEWWVNGERHRTDGPAIEYADGSKSWWVNGKFHRTDGPAVEYADGSKCLWCLNGKCINPKVLVKKGYMTEEELMLELL